MKTGLGARGRGFWTICLTLLFFVTGVAWAFSSSTGTSPDSDYHLTSMWCPKGLSVSSCDERIVNGTPTVVVPGSVANSSCTAFKPNVTGACSLAISDQPERTSRYDHGSYPYGYYEFHHLFVNSNLNVMVLTIRIVNVLIAAVILGALGWLLPTHLIPGFLFAIIGAWIPNGIYFIASVNPSSWSVTGMFAVAVGLTGVLTTRGSKRIGLTVVTAVGSLLCVASRGDATFLTAVVAVAVAVVFHRRILRDWNWTVPLGVFLVGIVMFLLGKQKETLFAGGESTGAHALGSAAIGAVSTNGATMGAIAATAAPERPGFLRLFLMNILEYPNYFAGFYGSNSGKLGWMDVQLYPFAIYGMYFFFGILLVIGLRTFVWSQALAALMILSTTVVIPAYFMAIRGILANGYFQPRYMLPMLAVFLFFWLADMQATEESVDTDGAYVSGPLHSWNFSSLQLGVACVFPILVNTFALRSVINRYTLGARNPKLGPIDTNTWWWNIPVPPSAVWVVGSVGFIVAVAGILIIMRRLGIVGSKGLQQSS
ncbi:hypothetical protein G7Y41_02405 [Schaalia sp. ZJ405]|uniref:DUF2142 domain-containing protein n=1 Tax=Schaalia sp. ZJ405 TaxID=2709403 RepID=UPI0013EB566E|nr:DUF2142 domain-containing protein [Schaalia sp. ZJ405]QPK81708.1 hypothetical protein G7Y41_02405 [Schaalia sp. ZJ405]